MPPIRTSHLLAGLLVLTVVAYLPLPNNDFIDFDDELYITSNPQVSQGLSREGLDWAWTTNHGNYWQPISWLSLQFDAHFFSTLSPERPPVLWPWAFHVENLCWHGASVLLLFGLWNRLTAAPWRSFLVAALFAVHPMHVESVAWAAERKDVLSVFFGIVTLWAYRRYLEKPGWKRYLATVAAFLLSLLSKPTLMTLPFVLLLLDYWPLRRLWSETQPPDTTRQPLPAPVSLPRLVLEKVPLFMLAAAIGIVTVLFREQAGAPVSLSVLPLSARLANALTAYGWYLSRTFWPWPLAVLYPHPYRNGSLLSAVLGAGMLLALTLLALAQARRRRWLIIGWLWFVGTLVPVIGLAQGGAQAWADRFSYWPHIGLFVALGWGLGELVEGGRIGVRVAGLAGALALGCLAVLTWLQVGYWKDTRTLWERALAVTSDNHRAHVCLGKYFQDRNALDKAAFHFAEAVRIRPDSPDHQYFLGVALLRLGREKEAIGHFLEAIKRAPKYTDAWHNLGVAWLRQGKPEAAVPCFRKALDLQPGSADTLAALGLALWRAGERSEALRTFQAALHRNPKEARAWQGLGLVYLAQGHLDWAIKAFSRVVELHPQLKSAHSDLGLALGRQGQWARAVSHHQTAIQLQDQAEQLIKKMNGRTPAPDSIPQVVIFRCRLAFTWNRLGDPQAAANEYQAALKRDPHWPEKFTAKAWSLATHPEVNFRDAQLAYELASQAIEAGDDPPAALLDVQAAALAALGQFPEAVRTAQQALHKATARAEAALARSIQDRLQLYQKGKTVTARSP